MAEGADKMKRRWAGCLLLVCLISLTGCGKKELLDEKLDGAEIDKIVVTLAMGNPKYGADCRVITDAAEIGHMLEAFNGAAVGEKVTDGEEWVAGSGSYAFFRGEEKILQLQCNANDPSRIWLKDAFYQIEYPEGMDSPFDQYMDSNAEIIVVDEEGNEMIRPQELIQE